MSDIHRKLSSLLQTAVVLLLAAGVFAVVCLYLGTSDIPLPAAFIMGRKQDPWQMRYAARFNRHADAAAVRSDTGPLRCRLVTWTGPAQDGGVAPDVRLELTNVSAEPVLLWYASGLECHVTLVVRREGDMVVGSFCLGYLASLPASFDSKTGRPQPLPPVLTLLPGETYSSGIRLQDVGNHSSGPSMPADYELEAVFLYEDLNGFPAADQHFVARSRPVAIRLVQVEGRGWPAWVLRSGPP
jgi:hypothetical protein